MVSNVNISTFLFMKIHLNFQLMHSKNLHGIDTVSNNFLVYYNQCYIGKNNYSSLVRKEIINRILCNNVIMPALSLVQM